MSTEEWCIWEQALVWLMALFLCASTWHDQGREYKRMEARVEKLEKLSEAWKGVAFDADAVKMAMRHELEKENAELRASHTEQEKMVAELRKLAQESRAKIVRLEAWKAKAREFIEMYLATTSRPVYKEESEIRKLLQEAE